MHVKKEGGHFSMSSLQNNPQGGKNREKERRAGVPYIAAMGEQAIITVTHTFCG